MKLSIVLPIYNTEHYLRRCLQSVFDQDLPAEEYELIAVNDGSTDGCPQILEEFAKKYPNLVYLSHENIGDALTRNRGIDAAKGKYLTFLDSDDAIENNTFKTIIEKAEKENLDILYMKMSQYDEEGNYLRDMPAIGEEGIVKSGFEHARRTFPATLYRRSIVLDTRFDKRILLGCDSVFNAIIQTRADRCSYISIPYYKYTNRQNSISKQGYTDRCYHGYIKSIELLADYKIANFPNPTQVQKLYFDAVINIFIDITLKLSIVPTLKKERFEELKKVLKGYDLGYLITDKSKEFKYFDKNFTIFYLYNKAKKIKQLLSSQK